MSACGHELANVSSQRIRQLTEKREAVDSYLTKYIHETHARYTELAALSQTGGNLPALKTAALSIFTCFLF